MYYQSITIEAFPRSQIIWKRQCLKINYILSLHSQSLQMINFTYPCLLREKVSITVWGEMFIVNLYFTYLFIDLFLTLLRQARGKPHPLCSTRGQRYMWQIRSNQSEMTNPQCCPMLAKFSQRTFLFLFFDKLFLGFLKNTNFGRFNI